MTEPDDDLLEVDDRIDERLDPDNRDIEAPEADAFEQATPANPAEQPVPNANHNVEANEYDVLEQERIVELDDDYR
jgi:hypothetical protein